MPFGTKAPLILLMSASVKMVPLLKAIVWELCKRFLSSVFSFCKIEGHCYWKFKLYRQCIQNQTSRLLQIGHKLEKVQWHQNLLTGYHRQIFVLIFHVNFRCWSTFHVNIITGSGVMAIFFYKRFTRNLEVGNTEISPYPPCEFCPISRDWGKWQKILPVWLRISGTVHHMTVIFGTRVKWWYLQQIFSFFKILIFGDFSGVKEKKMT